MNINKVQMEWLKAMQKDPSKVAIEELSDSFVIMLNGVVAYRLSEDDRLVNTISTQTTNALSLIMGDVYANHILQPTDRYRMAGTARMYLHDGDPDKPVYIDRKLLANLTEPQLCQGEYKPTGPIIVKEFQIIEDRWAPVGIVMPVRVKSEEIEMEE